MPGILFGWPLDSSSTALGGVWWSGCFRLVLFGQVEFWAAILMVDNVRLNQLY